MLLNSENRYKTSLVNKILQESRNGPEFPENKDLRMQYPASVGEMPPGKTLPVKKR
jgi:hypothetical protein